MGAKVGLWIDHRKAIIVDVTEKGAETSIIVSKTERQRRRMGDAPMKGPQDTVQFSVDPNRQRAFTRHLNNYYDAVIAAIKNARYILVLGPGEAKLEFKKRMDEQKLGNMIIGLEPADKMTERQVMLFVREYYKNEK